MSGLVLRAAYPGESSAFVAPAEPAATAVPAALTALANRRPRISLRRGPVGAALVVCTLLCSLIARPAYADPSSDIPDTGSRPVASGELVLPGSGATTAPPATTTTENGPKAAELTALALTVAQLGEKRNKASTELDTARNALADAEIKLGEATQRVQEQKQKADDAAAEAYKRATGLGPLDGYAYDLHGFGLIAPGFGGQPNGEEAARDLLRAQEAESAARQELQAAQGATQKAQDTYTPVDAEFQAQNAAYVKLRSDNEALVLQVEAQEEAAEQSLAPSQLAFPAVNGMKADARAIQALNYALSKVNISWYVWGDEGPDTFDCSGLAYWAYGKVGVHVPRVAADMYHGTRAVPAGSALLPGDLVYFATDKGDWRTIYHMGIYIGDGKMVNAPTSGQKVKIASVRWSSYFGATRIFDAVAAPGQGTTTAPPPAGGGGTTTATPTPTNTGSPTPTPTTSVSPTTSTSPSNSTSPSPSNSTSPSPSKSTSPSPSTQTSVQPSTQPPSPTTSAKAASSSPAAVKTSQSGASTKATTSSSAAAK